MLARAPQKSSWWCKIHTLLFYAQNILKKSRFIDKERINEQLWRDHNSQNAQIAYNLCKSKHLNVMVITCSVSIFITKNSIPTVNDLCCRKFWWSHCHFCKSQVWVSVAVLIIVDWSISVRVRLLEGNARVFRFGFETIGRKFEIYWYFSGNTNL